MKLSAINRNLDTKVVHNHHPLRKTFVDIDRISRDLSVIWRKRENINNFVQKSEETL